MSGRVMMFEDFELSAEAFELRRAGEVVAMEPQVFEVLVLLVENAGRVVPKDEIIAAVWPSGFISDAALNSRIMAARRAVGDSGDRQRLIRTIRGRGYRFVGEVIEAGDLAPTAVAEPASPEKAPEQSQAVSLEVAATSFVGRGAELARLEDLLGRPACRLLTIVGPGGVGKTRLVSQLASLLRSRGRDVTTIALHGVESVHGMHLAVAREMQLQLAEPTVERIASALARRNATLVLDNLEQLLPDAAASLARLVAETSGLRVIVTSREVIGLRDEWVFPIGGLGQYAGSEGLSDAEVLFLERETQSGAGAGEPPDETVRRICELVDGMPLGLELAAALRRYLTRHEIAQRVENDIGVLLSDLRDVPQRHRSIPGLLEESLRRLDADALNALLALSVFEGTFSLEAAQQVTGASLAVVRSLVDRSLVQSSDGAYSLHPLFRQLALERLGPLRPAVEQAHAEYYAGFSDRLRPELESSGQLSAAAALDAEFRDVLAAWRWAARNSRLDLVQAIAYPLFIYAQVRSRFPDIRDAVDDAVAAAERAGEPAWQVLALLLAIRSWLEIRTTRAPRLLRDVRDVTLLYLEHEGLPPHGFGMDPHQLEAMLHWGAGRYDQILGAATRAEIRAHERHDFVGEACALWLGAIALDRLAALTWEQGDHGGGTYRPADAVSKATLRDAMSRLDRASGFFDEGGEHWFLATLNIERAVNAQGLGDGRAAVRFGHKALEFRRSLRDPRGTVDALISLGDSHMNLGEAAAAREVLTEAEALVHRLGDVNMVTEYERAMGLLWIVEGDLAAALDLLVSSVRHSQAAGSANNVLGSLRGIADVLWLRGDLDLACQVYAFVWAHPATTPFSVAKSRAVLEMLGVDVDSLPRPEMRLHEFASHVTGLLAGGQ